MAAKYAFLSLSHQEVGLISGAESIRDPGEIPSFKLIETELSFSFLDIGPLSKGHALVSDEVFTASDSRLLTLPLPDHAQKLHELPDEYLADAMPIAKKIALAQGAENYNVLQNNGRLAHQEVDHVHFHVIPKPSAEEGLIVGWPTKSMAKEELQALHDEMKGKL
ncbi:HIT domain-containing protein [Mycena sanguinolenta]|uniref:HIT domain-containing protein n=1 Tax=Mycena sanguinolenta TaxID=230812 RepID=A0A8H7D396_9AGAR|nr:HIT domain-containing protein [Mycena sanguinolenta]